MALEGTDGAKIAPKGPPPMAQAPRGPIARPQSTMQQAPPKIMLAIPNMAFVATELMMTILRWVTSGQYQLTVYPPMFFSPVSYARNHCAEEFLKSDFDYLLFIDDDTVPPLDAIDRLLQPQVKAIIGVTRTMKTDDGTMRPVPVVMKRVPEGLTHYQGKGIEQVDAGGLSCALLHKDVFKNLTPPFFDTGHSDADDLIGEDFRFFTKMTAHGIPLFANFDVNCKHWKKVPI